MTRAYIPDRDLPNFAGKERDVSAAMLRLRERVMVGKFLAERQTPEAVALVLHVQHHKLASRWARVPRQEWCGICVLGEDVWSRYEAGLIQPIAPTEDVPEPVEVQYSAPERPELPSLPVEGFMRRKKK